MGTLMNSCESSSWGHRERTSFVNTSSRLEVFCESDMIIHLHEQVSYSPLWSVYEGERHQDPYASGRWKSTSFQLPTAPGWA